MHFLNIDYRKTSTLFFFERETFIVCGWFDFDYWFDNMDQFMVIIIMIIYDDDAPFFEEYEVWLVQRQKQASFTLCELDWWNWKSFCKCDTLTL